MLNLIIIVVNHNHGDLARRAVESLYTLPDQTRFQLIAVDNATTDGFAGWLSNCYPQATVIKNIHPQGFAHNNNQAIRHAPDSTYILLLNPDIECQPGLLDILIAFMDAHPNVGIAGPKLLNPDLTSQPSARRFSTPLPLLARGMHLDGILKNTRFMRDYLGADFNSEDAMEVDWVTGALMIVRRRAISQVGLMDEDYFLYAEDQDWCCRMWRAGWSVYYVPQARAIHKHLREGMRKPWSKATRYQLISAFLMFRKFGWRLSRTT